MHAGAAAPLMTEWQAVAPPRPPARLVSPSRAVVRVAAAAASALAGAALLAGSGWSSAAGPPTVAAARAGSWAADHQTGLAAAPRLPQLATGQPPQPPLPAGWKAAWDHAAHRYYFYDAAGAVTWDLPEVAPPKPAPPHFAQAQPRSSLAAPPAPASSYDAHYANAGWNAAAEKADPSNIEYYNSNYIPDVIAYWEKRGAEEMQQSKFDAFDAAVKDNYDNLDLKKGRAMHKIFHGAQGGGGGYYPDDAPYYPKAGEIPQQGLQRAMADNYDAYDVKHGLAIHKIWNGKYACNDFDNTGGQGCEVDESGWGKHDWDHVEDDGEEEGYF